MQEEFELTMSSVKVEAKPREVKEMSWWWCYKLFPHGIDTRFKRFCVSIEKLIRFIIRKPVKKSKPTFEVQDIQSIPSDAEDLQ